MNKIAVTYNDSLYAWVDTITKTDEYEYTCAVLVSLKTGKVFTIEISNIEVVDLDIRL